MKSIKKLFALSLGLWMFLGNGEAITKTVGTGQNYATLKLAFAAINTNSGNTFQGAVVLQIAANVSEADSAVLLKPPTNGYTSVLIYPTSAGLSVTGTKKTVIRLDGATNVTIDGRVNQIGAADLKIENTGTCQSTISFWNSAQTNTIKYCKIFGNGTIGIINFSKSTTGTGNKNNTISYNEITSYTGSRPIAAINSMTYTAATFSNSGITIDNNKFYDFINLSSNSFGINIGDYSSDFTITNNSFCESGTSSSATGFYQIINVNSPTGSKFNISNNFIGGSTGRCGGTWAKAGNANDFYAIKVNAGGTGTNATTIQGNKIKNLNLTNVATAKNFYGIYVSGACEANIGTTTANIIGAATGNDSIILSNNANGANFTGIYLANSGATSCDNNTVGSIKADNRESIYATHCYGINKTNSGGTLSINNNLIGSQSTAGSITATGTSTGSAQNLRAIYSQSAATVTINNNIIANIENKTNAAFGQVCGIYTANGLNTITGNTIKNLSIYNSNSTESTESPIIGISIQGTGVDVSSNTIHSLFNEKTDGTQAFLFGIFDASSGNSKFTRNFIYNLNNNVPTSLASINGIRINNTATSEFSNNVISLTETAGSNLFGIWDVGSGTTSLYFNTVYLGGTNTVGSVNSSAMYSNNPNVRTYKYNIFNNSHHTAGTDYAIYYFSGTSGLISNYNNYFAGTYGTLGYLGGPILTLSDLRSATVDTSIPTYNDVSSYNINPLFVGTDFSVAESLKIGAKSMVNPNLDKIVLNDYSNATRQYFSSVGAFEVDMNRWKGTVDNQWNLIDNWTALTIPAADESIYFDDAAMNILTQDQDRSITSLYNNTAYYVDLNGKKLTVKGDFYNQGATQIDASIANSNLELNGSAAQTIGPNLLLNNTVQTLTISNSLNVSLNSPLTVLNDITATAGRLDATTNTPAITYGGTAAQNLNGNAFTNNKLYDLVVDNSAGVSLASDLTVQNTLTINSTRLLTIPTQKSMNVFGTITNNAGVNGLVIKASPDGTTANGTLIFNNDAFTPVPATVEMYSKASWNRTAAADNRYKWQFIGVPVQSMTVNNNFSGAFIRKHNEPGTAALGNYWIQLQNGATLTSFTGYEIVQAAAKVYTFQGNLENQSQTNMVLSYTPEAKYPGQHIIGNSYTAAIDITQLSFGTNTEASVYLYNTGTYNDWYTNSPNSVDPSSTPGQYVVSTPGTAGSGSIPSQIPSMAAYLVIPMVTNTSTADTITIPYSAVAIKNTDLQRARAVSKIFTTIDVKGSRYSDRMWIFSNASCTRNFDNGWDGRKFLGSPYTPQLYAQEADGDYQIDAVDNINNTELAFMTGEDTNYTLTFTHDNYDLQYSGYDLFLLDLVDNTKTDITQSGSSYSFTAVKSATATKRFKIITSPKLATAVSNSEQNGLTVYTANKTIFVQNSTDQNGIVTITDLAGRVISNSRYEAHTLTGIPTQLNSGSYFVTVNSQKGKFTKIVVLK